MSDYRSPNHTKSECKYHVVFIPKYRKKRIALAELRAFDCAAENAELVPQRGVLGGELGQGGEQDHDKASRRLKSLWFEAESG